MVLGRGAGSSVVPGSEEGVERKQTGQEAIEGDLGVI